MIDFGALPPEVNSARMYAGPGPLSLTAAAVAWDALAAELHAAASCYRSVIAGLTTGRWLGPAPPVGPPRRPVRPGSPSRSSRPPSR